MATIRDGVIDLEVDVPEAAELAVHGHSGDITVTAVSGSLIRIHAEGINPHAMIEDEPFTTSLVGNRLTVDMHRNAAALGADLGIEVPVGCAVIAHTVEGDIRVERTHAPVEITSVGGDIVIEDVDGAARVTTVGGDIHGDRLSGTLTLHTTNGDVTVRRSALRRFNVHSVNGSLALETPLTRGEHYFAKTTNGDIRISVPTGTGAIVQMRTTNGELSCDLPTDVINRSRRNWQGRINDGGATLELETLNGDVLIEESAFSGAREAGPAPEAPPPPQAPAGLDTDWTPEPPEMPDIPGMPDLSEMPDPGSGISMQTPEAPGSDARSTEHRVDYGSADSISILTRLERGEITIEEAMEKLDALR